MEVKINREIRDYTESLFFGLSMRQFTFSVLAILVAVSAYFTLKPSLGAETVSWVCVLCAAPFAAMGFVKYNGMTAERFAWAWLRSEFIVPKRLLFRAENIYYEAMKQILESPRNKPRSGRMGAGADRLTRQCGSGRHSARDDDERGMRG